jgi:predicted DNA-binding transcriptional regulator AlpA
MGRIKELPISMDRVVELTGYKKSYIYKLVCWKRIPCHKPTHGRLFFYESEIIDFLASGKQAADYEVLEAANAILNREVK